MSVAVCRSSAAGFESILALSTTWLQTAAEAEHKLQLQLNSPTRTPPLHDEEEEEYVNSKGTDEEEAERPPGQLDIWSSIQAHKAKQESQSRQDEEPYVHPLVRRSSSLLSKKSLEICTENLGSENGSDEFLSSDDETDLSTLIPKKEEMQQEEEEEEEEEELEYVGRAKRNGPNGRKELATVNYHCSISRRSSVPRSFPPPLPSISRRDGPCLQMRPHRRDGRLVVEAVTVPSQNYLHAERHNGRLLLSFINTCSSSSPHQSHNNAHNYTSEQTFEEAKEENLQQAEELEGEEVTEAEEEEEEEVEVVDRGTVVEVKVSTQPQQNSGAAAMKVHRSSIVINKFVSCTPVSDDQITGDHHTTAAAPPVSPVRRQWTTTTTAAAAAVAASSLSAFPSAEGSHSSTTDNKLLFTSRRRNREELLHDMRRCSELRKPLFIWEPCCIATSS